MKTGIRLIIIAAIFGLAACSSTEGLFTSKRYKNCVAEKDWLKTQYMNLKADTTKLRNDLMALQEEYDKLKAKYSKSVNDYKELNNIYNSLNERHTELDKKYKELTNINLTKTEQLSMALKEKSEDLRVKESLLMEREKKLKELQDIIRRQDSVTKALTGTVNEALTGFKPDELNVEVKNSKVYVSMMDKLLFKSGSITVEAKGMEALKKLAAVLIKNPEIDVLVEGHTDNVPIKTPVYKDNWDLSVARATSIVRILSEEYKVPPTRMIASGRGEYYPVGSNETTEGRAKNRRTEIIMSPKLELLFKALKQGK
jgi:chemotaxis protein MotB